MAQTLELFIAGAKRPPRTDERVDVWDPATGGILARVPLCGSDDVADAVAAAREAFGDWAETPVPVRARVMFRLQALVERHLDELAELVVRENGKRLDEARGEVRRGLEVVEFAAGMPTLMMGGGLEQVSRGVDTDMYRYPLGVVAGITPFNFPVMIPLWMAPIAIAAGNTFVLKPSQRTPLSAMRLAELFAEAGVPEGVFNVVHGAEQASNALIDHPDVRAVSFVGSETVARAVYARAASAGKRVQALAGAKNHMVVMPDANLDLVADSIFSSAFGNAGERCLAGSVAMPLGDVADPLLERLVDRAHRARLGSGLDPETILTPVTTDVHRRRVASWIQKGVDEGAKLVVDGRTASAGDGFFLGPTILDHVRPDMSVAQEEIFGPVLAVERMEDLDQAIEVINRSRFGNAAVIFTRSGAAARTFRRKVQAGMIGVNVGVPAPMAFFPFAGWKNSFFGDLHATGRDAVEFFTERKVVTSRWY
ncbi:MAG TPA: CoA-acylating methylmalonate-semialdehyde dehydrogenase [Bacillota bacterium]